MCAASLVITRDLRGLPRPRLVGVSGTLDVSIHCVLPLYGDVSVGLSSELDRSTANSLFSEDSLWLEPPSFVVFGSCRRPRRLSGVTTIVSFSSPPDCRGILDCSA